MKLRAIDLFCGAGGFSRGLVDAGYEVVAAIDSWDVALRSYRANFPTHPALLLDASNLTASALGTIDCTNLDLLAGGPPCQGFSIQRIGRDEDDRNDLVLAFARCVSEFQPRCFLMENVPGLMGRRGKHVVHKFIALVSKAGYEVQSKIVDAADFGVPQTRRRVLFVGWRRKEFSEFRFPISTHTQQPITVRDAIGDLVSPPADFSPASFDSLHRRMKLSARNLERLKHIPPGGGFEDLPVDLRVDCHKAGAARIGHRSVYGRLDPDRPAATITARFDSFTRGKFGHPWEDRNITLREGARLQGFPDNHEFYGTQEEIAAQIGNAVPPALSQALGNAIREFLSGEGGSEGDQMALPLRRSPLTAAA